MFLKFVIDFIKFSAGIIFLLIVVLAGSILYSIKNTQWRVDELHATLKVGDSITQKLEDPDLLKKIFKTKYSSLSLYNKLNTKKSCMDLSAWGGGNVMLIGEDFKYTKMSLVELSKNIEIYNSRFLNCSRLRITVMGGASYYRGTLKIHYNENLIITKVEDPYFWD